MALIKTETHWESLLQHIPVHEQTHYIRSNIMRCIMTKSDLDPSNVSEICIMCGNTFKKNGDYHILLPSKKKNRFLRRLSKNQPDCGTLYQMRSLKKLKKYSVQHLANYCQFCKYKHKRVIQNNKRDEPVAGVGETINPKITPKKKKKNAFAGLNTSAVLAVKRTYQVGNKFNKNSYNHHSDKLKIDNNIICIDESPTPNQLKYPNFISLASPKSTSNPDVINLITPKNKYANTSDFINLVTPKISTSNTELSDFEKRARKIRRDIEKRRNKIQKIKMSKQNTPQSVQKNAKPFRASEQKAKPKARRLNSLSYLLQEDSQINKTVSNLENFLSSIPNN